MQYAKYVRYEEINIKIDVYYTERMILLKYLKI